MTRRWASLFAVAILATAFSAPISAQQESIEELRARAEAGDAAAQNHLGLMYAIGEGVPEDDVQAHMWFNLAAASNIAERWVYVDARDRTARQMTSDQRAEAQRLAREWDAAHPHDYPVEPSAAWR